MAEIQFIPNRIFFSKSLMNKIPFTLIMVEEKKIIFQFVVLIIRKVLISIE